MSFERDLTADLELALCLADIADEISLKRFEALDLIIESKPDISGNRCR